MLNRLRLNHRVRNITGFVLGILSVVSAIGADFYAHPMFENTVKFPSQKVEDSRYAALIAADAYLRSLKEPVAVGTPLPMKMENDKPPFARKGDDLWEVALSSERSRKVVAVFVINARTGAVELANYVKSK